VQLPTDEEIRAAAERDGSIEPGADLPPALRKAVAARLLAEKRENAAPQPPAPEGVPGLLSRTRQLVPGGTLVVDVVFIPSEKKD
jgi:hypothetical protein